MGDFSVVGHQKSLFVDKNGELVSSLLEVFERVTCQKSQPIAIGGGTYARSMQNCVAFGPVFSEQDAVCHEPNEYINIKDLMLGYEIYKQAIIKLCK